MQSRWIEQVSLWAGLAACALCLALFLDMKFPEWAQQWVSVEFLVWAWLGAFVVFTSISVATGCFGLFGAAEFHKPGDLNRAAMRQRRLCSLGGILLSVCSWLLVLAAFVV